MIVQYNMSIDGIHIETKIKSLKCLCDCINVPTYNESYTGTTTTLQIFNKAENVYFSYLLHTIFLNTSLIDVADRRDKLTNSDIFSLMTQNKVSNQNKPHSFWLSLITTSVTTSNTYWMLLVSVAQVR